MDAVAAKHVGARLLSEVEEGSLEELLESLSTNLAGGPSTIRPDIPIAALSTIATRYHKATHSAPPPVLSVGGRYLPLLYHLISTLISAPHNYAVVVIDAENRFDVTRLISSSPSPSTNPPHSIKSESNGNNSYPAQPQDLRHVYVYRPARGPEHIQAAVAAAGEWMVYGGHGSRAREWWGTVVIGGGGSGAKSDVSTGWKGWLRVEREEVPGFAAGVSMEEALRDRHKRQDAVDAAGWMAMSKVGGYVWK